MTTTYNILVDGETVAQMSADFAQASSPVFLDDGSTPFQVADFRHRTIDAAERLLIWAWRNGAPIVECEHDENGNVEPCYEHLSVNVAE